jgi:hypothetical protein
MKQCRCETTSAQGQERGFVVAYSVALAAFYPTVLVFDL